MVQKLYYVFCLFYLFCLSKFVPKFHLTPDLVISISLDPTLLYDSPICFEDRTVLHNGLLCMGEDRIEGGGFPFIAGIGRAVLTG